MSDEPPAFSWSTTRTMRVWGYGAGHSQLRLRSSDRREPEMLQAEFTGVDRMELDVHYGGGLTIASVRAHGPYPGILRDRRLLLELTSPDKQGFVVCSGLRITRRSWDDEELELLFATTEKEKGEAPGAYS